MDGRNKQKRSAKDEDMIKEDQGFKGEKGGQSADETTEIEDLSKEDADAITKDEE